MEARERRSAAREFSFVRTSWKSEHHLFLGGDRVVSVFVQIPEPVHPVGWDLPLLAGGRADGAIGSIRGMGSGPTSVWARKMVPFLSSSLAMLRASFL